ncbi:hypothetical protein [Orientia tsutsugamushi]|uniref:hypothetical protein n=1 Tax=Orientia tsutsugamushi TaxID=784 RepID=UPI003527EF35
MPEIKLNLRPNLLRLFQYLSAIILNYVNRFQKRSILRLKCINLFNRKLALNNANLG